MLDGPARMHGHTPRSSVRPASTSKVCRLGERVADNLKAPREAAMNARQYGACTG